jgi:hypothetical protein
MVFSPITNGEGLLAANAHLRVALDRSPRLPGIAPVSGALGSVLWSEACLHSRARRSEQSRARITATTYLCSALLMASFSM